MCRSEGRCTVNSRGTSLLQKHRSGVRLTQRQAILAKCADCTCEHADGRQDCSIPECPLYRWMPYRDAAAREDGVSVPQPQAAVRLEAQTPTKERRVSPATVAKVTHDEN
jgi:hypothetical protein